jgi:single-stranded DNA-binding protein
MSNETKEYKKLDTYAQTIYLVKLAQDPKVYKREDESHDVVLTFCDSSRFDNLEDLWVDARVVRGQSDRAKRLRKGDMVQIAGKLRFKKQDDGKIRGKIYDAVVQTFTQTADREEMQPDAKFE